MTASKKLLNIAGISLLGIIFAVLALFVIASAFFPELLPSTETYPSMDPAYDMREQDNPETDSASASSVRAADPFDVLHIRTIGDDEYEIRQDAFARSFFPSFTELKGNMLASVQTEGTLSCEAGATHIVGYNVSCLELSTEGAAGSIYRTYTAKILNDMGIVTMTWTLREVTCGPQYDTREEVERCEKNRAAFWATYSVEPIVEKAESLLLIFR